jgi:hypothetical protein
LLFVCTGAGEEKNISKEFVGEAILPGLECTKKKGIFKIKMIEKTIVYRILM